MHFFGSIPIILSTSTEALSCQSITYTSAINLILSLNEQHSSIAEALGGGALCLDVNEVLLLHGVASLSVAESILQNGLNERLAGSSTGSAFGEGTYLAGVQSCDTRSPEFKWCEVVLRFVPVVT
jgi:hypothetical protein